MSNVVNERDNLRQLRDEEEHWSKQDNYKHHRRRPEKVRRERQRVRHLIDHAEDD